MTHRRRHVLTDGRAAACGAMMTAKERNTNARVRRACAKCQRIEKNAPLSRSEMIA